jgi:hypothetical protein
MYNKKIFSIGVLIEHIHVDLRWVLSKKSHATIFPRLNNVIQKPNPTWSTFLA